MPDIFVAKKTAQKKSSGKHPHLLDSFCQDPDGIFFEDQEDNEKILLFLRRHFITNLGWILTSILLIIVPFIFIFLSPHLSVFSFLNLPQRFIAIFIVFYYLLVLTYIFVNFITWYFNISLITNKRVIDINFADLVYKNVAATKISLVQDASYTQVGVLRSFFDYGDVLVQTAGTLDNFLFDKVPKPEKVVQIVEGLIGKKE